MFWGFLLAFSALLFGGKLAMHIQAKMWWQKGALPLGNCVAAAKGIYVTHHGLNVAGVSPCARTWTVKEPVQFSCLFANGNTNTPFTIASTRTLAIIFTAITKRRSGIVISAITRRRGSSAIRAKATVVNVAAERQASAPTRYRS